MSTPDSCQGVSALVDELSRERVDTSGQPIGLMFELVDERLAVEMTDRAGENIQPT